MFVFEVDNSATSQAEATEKQQPQWHATDHFSLPPEAYKFFQGVKAERKALEEEKEGERLIGTIPGKTCVCSKLHI